MQISEGEGQSILDTALFITRNGGASIVNFSMNEDDVRHIMQIPWVATASDGSAKLPGSDRPHPRSYGTFARKIGHYSVKERVLSEAAAIRSAAGLPAKILGMTDRGTLKSGFVADIAVYDPKKFIDKATFDDPHQFCVGIRHVFVNGQTAVYNGQPTGARPGKTAQAEVTIVARL